MPAASPFSFRDYRAFWLARLASTIGNTMLVVVIGIHVYDIARQTMSIGEASFAGAPLPLPSTHLVR